MKIAVPSQGNTKDSIPDSRFGRAKNFMVYNDQNELWEAIDNIQNMQAAQGAGIQSAAHIVNAGATHLLSGNCGPKAFAVLEKAGVSVFRVEGKTVEEMVKKYMAGTAEQMTNANVEGHW